MTLVRFTIRGNLFVSQISNIYIRHYQIINPIQSGGGGGGGAFDATQN